MKLILLFCALLSLLFTASLSHAAGPVITSVSGASGFAIATTGTSATTATIFAGLAGADCAGTTTGSTCDSCDAALMTCASKPLCACNPARPRDGGALSIVVTPPTGVTGNVSVVFGTNNLALTKITSTSSTVDFNWTEICKQTDAANTTCSAITANTQLAAKIFIDKDANGTVSAGEETTDFTFKFIKPTTDTYDVFNGSAFPSTDGIGGLSGSPGFVPYPGDEKVYIEDTEASTSFPNMAYGARATAVRVWNSDAGLAGAVIGAPFKDLPISTDGNLENNVVGDLTNDKTVVFRLAIKDEANNIVQFFPAAAADPNCDVAPDFTNCPWAATPERVLGLLTKDVNCFIATAAYGSALEPKLDTFRLFRHKFLLRSAWGRSFVDWYYHYGPIAARFIYDKPAVRALARAGLWPLYLFSGASLKFGLYRVTLCLILLMAGFIALGLRLRRFLAGR